MYCISPPWSWCRGNDERRGPKSTVRSAAFEFRLALLAEGLDALPEVVRRAKQPVRQALELEPDRERRVVDVIEHPLGHPEGERRELVQVRDYPIDGGVELLRGHDLGDETPGERLLCGDPAAAHDH